MYQTWNKGYKNFIFFRSCCVSGVAFGEAWGYPASPDVSKHVYDNFEIYPFFTLRYFLLTKKTQGERRIELFEIINLI